MKCLFTREMRLFVKNRIAPTIVGCLVLSTMSQPLMGMMDEDRASTYKQSLSFETLASLFPTPLLPVADKTPENEEEKAKKLRETIKEGLPQISKNERIKTLFNLYCSTETTEEKVSALKLVKDLELFVNENSSQGASILSTIDQTTTTFGKIHLAHLLANPTNSIEELKKRQALIRELVENEELFNQVSALLAKAKESENGLFSLWRDEDATTQDYLKKNVYFPQKSLAKLNKNTPAMGLTNRLGNVSTLKNAAEPLSSSIITYYLTGKAMTLGISYITPNDTPNRAALMAQLHQTYPSFKELVLLTAGYIKKGCSPSTYKNIYNAILEGTASYNEPEGSSNKAILGTAAVGAAAVGVGALVAYSAHSAFSDAALKQAAINRLQQRLIDTNTVVTCGKELEALTSNNTALAQGLTTLPTLKDFFKPSDNKELDTLKGNLQTNTFTGSPSFFSYSGRVIASHELMTHHKDRFVPTFRALGELDAYLSIAKLYKESQKTTTHYSFADFEQKNDPSLALKGFWHPLVQPEKVVKNDLSLGKVAGHRDILLTGSNTGGKSTLLKSALISLLLAQTCTIAPADKLTFTPFTTLGSYLHVSDDISQGQSLFKAEALRAKALMDETSQLKPNEHAFVVIDELFTGAAADKGAAAAEKVAEKLIQKENVLFVLATHFPSLTSLEKKFNRIKNFKIDVIKNADGSITRPFKIEPGVSTENIANDILNEEMTDIDFMGN